MKPSETDMQQDLVQEVMIYHIEAPAIGDVSAIEPPVVGTPLVGAPVIGSSYSATEIRAVVVRVYSQLEEHGKMLLKLDDHGKILHNHGKILEQILMSTVRDSTLPLGDTPLLGQYQFSTPEKTVKHKREGGNEKDDGKMKMAEPRTWQRDLQEKNQKIEEKKKGKEKLQKKTNANKKNKKAEEADVPLKKKVEGTKKETFTNEQFDDIPLIQLKTLIPKIPKKGLAKRVPRKRRMKFLELENIQSTAKNLLQQVAPGDGLEVVKDLMVDDDVEVNLEAISSEYGDGLLKWKKDDEKYDDNKKDVEEEVKSKEEQPQVTEEEDSKPPTVVVYYNGNKDIQHAHETMVVVEVAKTDIVFFSQEKVVGEAYQASADQTIAVSIEEQTIEAVKTKVVISHQEEGVDEASQTKESKEKVKQSKEEVIDVYNKALIQYFDTQHRARPDKERIMLVDVFAYQYIDRVFNVWTHNMPSPEGVELRKKLIWEQITSTQWEYRVSNYIHRGDLKVVNSKLILIPWNLNDNHWVLYAMSFKGRKICIYDSMVDAKITNAQKKKMKLSHGHQLIED
ncbi:hypothetical protein GIB67_039523 [Kingdonia uniflora]|uniref:Ubiquitin-like protease family profile domain-containing protein n=1 Tax=Kingdonia uniflora TaxID=39325 RepID=A0A7J7LJ24_9MAGN|nr:hypothetical protein GIB67_039523 [Kingdonia uniflora]